MKPKLKNYRVIQKIGQGGMGLVYVAEDLALGRLVALKVLAPYLVQDPEILERFRTEARNQARLVHPNITMVYSFLVEEQQAFLVLEFIDGETLESRINREGRIAAVEAVAIFRKILAAINYAHSKGVIHRDIKPGNIAFTSEGHVKLMDFGIALNIEEGGRLTRTGHVLGTPHYMAPEQILSQEVTFATDIYALGITLFEMVTGRLPFDSKSDYEVRIAQVNHPPPPPRSFGFPDITVDLEEVILKSLAKAPGDRFASAEDFLKDMEDAVKCDHAVTVVKGRRLDRTTQAVKRPRKSADPPSEPEREEPLTSSPEPESAESGSALASQTEEQPPSYEEPKGEPHSPSPGAPSEDHFGPRSLGQPREDAVLASNELLQKDSSPASPLTPPLAEPAERLLEKEKSLLSPEEINELSGPSPFEPSREASSGSASESGSAGPPSQPPPEAGRQEPSTPLLSGQGVAEVSLPPPVEVPREVTEPRPSLPKKQPGQEPAIPPVSEGPFVTPEGQRGVFARSRLIFLPLALLPLLALIILFRAHIFPGPSVTPKASLYPPPRVVPAKPAAPPAQAPEEKLPVAATKPPAQQPLEPVSKEAAVLTGAAPDKVVRDQPEQKEPVTLAALPSAEKKGEAPEVKEPKPVDLQKTIKERLAADGFPDLQVRMDAKKGAVISGKVKNLVQKNRIIRIVNSMGLSTPVDYDNLKIIREVVVETVKKKVQEERPRITRTPEAPPRSAPPEAPRKPLPPRLDRGNIQF